MDYSSASLYYLQTLPASQIEQIWSTLPREKRQQLINYLPCYRHSGNNRRINCIECRQHEKTNMKLYFK